MSASGSGMACATNASCLIRLPEEDCTEKQFPDYCLPPVNIYRIDVATCIHSSDIISAAHTKSCFQKRLEYQLSDLFATYPNMTNVKEAEELKAMGNKHFGDGNFEQAAKCYTRSLAKEFALATLTNRSLTNLKLGNNLQAYIDANEATKFNTKYVKALFRRALALMELGSEARALQDLRHCLKLEPQNPKLREQLSIWLRKLSRKLCSPSSDQLNRFEGTLKEQLKILDDLEMKQNKRKEQIAKAEAMNIKVGEFFNQKNYELALEFSKRASKLDMSNPLTHLHTSTLHLILQSNYEQAYFEANEALNLKTLDNTNKEMAEMISRLCLSAMGIVPYHPSKWAHHINCSEFTIGNLPCETNLPVELPIPLTAKDEMQRCIHPAVEFEFFEHFLNNNVSGPLGTFRCLHVTWDNDFYNRICKVDMDRFYSTELFFDNCDFRGLSINQFTHLFNEVFVSRKKLEFGDLLLPAGISPSDLFKFKAMREAFLLGFYLGRSALNDPNYGVRFDEIS
uniref:Uncharacterized protein n=1 Tax=Ditylenchus dipsaci TaxID=166011 RepID=A0A915CRH7_9BILA